MAYHPGEALGRLLASLEGEVEGVTVVRTGANLGFAAGNNLGARHATGDALVLLNPDTVVAPGALAALVEPLEDPEVGIVSARLRLLDEPELLNSAGNEVHVAGIAGGRPLRRARRQRR